MMVQISVLYGEATGQRLAHVTSLQATLQRIVASSKERTAISV